MKIQLGKMNAEMAKDKSTRREDGGRVAWTRGKAPLPRNFSQWPLPMRLRFLTQRG